MPGGRGKEDPLAGLLSPGPSLETEENDEEFVPSEVEGEEGSSAVSDSEDESSSRRDGRRRGGGSGSASSSNGEEDAEGSDDDSEREQEDMPEEMREALRGAAAARPGTAGPSHARCLEVVPLARVACLFLISSPGYKKQAFREALMKARGVSCSSLSHSDPACPCPALMRAAFQAQFQDDSDVPFEEPILSESDISREVSGLRLAEPFFQGIIAGARLHASLLEGQQHLHARVDTLHWPFTWQQVFLALLRLHLPSPVP